MASFLAPKNEHYFEKNKKEAEMKLSFCGAAKLIHPDKHISRANRLDPRVFFLWLLVSEKRTLYSSKR